MRQRYVERESERGSDGGLEGKEKACTRLECCDSAFACGGPLR